MKIDAHGNAAENGIDFNPNFAKKSSKNDFVKVHAHHKDDTNLEKAWETLRKGQEEEKASVPEEEPKTKAKNA